MLGIKAPKRRNSREDGEKPFWISFSDLMTALMVLFLVAMAVALMAVTQGLQQIKKATEERDKTIESCVADVDALTKLDEFKGVIVRDHSIDFGTLVQFQDNAHKFENPGDEHFVRKFVPRVLDVARSAKCEKWLKRVVVEGFASKTGDYLFNLNLSYLRSQRVLCAFANGFLQQWDREAWRSQQRRSARVLSPHVRERFGERFERRVEKNFARQHR
jgi:flagellar motor protein MotB